MASSIQSVRVPAIIKGHQHFSYGGATSPDSVIVEQYYNLTPSKKSNVRPSDEIIPKPTDINIGDKQIKVSIQRDHPHHSFISSCAIFPTYHCPDDPDTGVRAACKLPINPLIPANPHQVTLLSKTKGAPYRHELIHIAMETRRDALTWPGQNGFLNHIKPVKGETQVFYPKAPKTLSPNLTLRDWKYTLLERTANVLRNLEKSQWLTSYQLHYTGTGPTNPIKLDDYTEKTISMITGETNPYTAQLRERSYPVFLPPRPLEGRKARILQNRRRLEIPCPPCSPFLSPEPPDAGKVFTHTQLDTPYSASLKDEDLKYNKANELYQTCRVIFNNTAYMCDVCCEGNCVCNLSESDGTKPQTYINKPVLSVNERENTNLEQDIPEQMFQSKEIIQNDLSNTRTQNYVIEKRGDKMEMASCISPIHPRSTRSSKDLGSHVLELQDSFSRTKAHQIFHESMQDATLDLRDNHNSGKKHFFYGLNSYYFHK